MKNKQIKKAVAGAMATTILMNPMPLSIYANEIKPDVSTEDTNNVETNPITNDTNEIPNNPTEKDKVSVPEETPEKPEVASENNKELKKNEKTAYGNGYRFETSYSDNKYGHLHYNLSTGEDIHTNWHFALTNGTLSEYSYTFTNHTEEGERYVEFTKLPVIKEDSQGAFTLEYSTDGSSFSTDVPELKNLVAFRVTLKSTIEGDEDPKLNVEYTFKPINIPKDFVNSEHLIIGGYQTTKYGDTWVSDINSNMIHFYERTPNHSPEIHAEDKTIKVGDKFNPMTGVTAIDKEDGNITKDIKVIENTVDTSKGGKYKVVYSVTDSNGATTTKDITVTVKLKDLTLNNTPEIHAENKTIKVGDPFNPLDGVTAIDEEDGNITKHIKVIENTVDTSEVGIYKVTYKVTDSKRASTTKSILVTVRSNDKPLIIGADDTSIKEGTLFDPMDGVAAIDTEDGNITKHIKVDGYINTNKPGTYELMYKVNDKDGNTDTVKRTIIVNPKELHINNLPVINASNKTIKVGDKFNPMTGVTATDKEDGNITKHIKVNGSVDTNKPGTYELTYTVTDKNGNSTTTKRTITVSPKDADNVNLPEINEDDKTPNVGDTVNSTDRPRSSATDTDTKPTINKPNSPQERKKVLEVTISSLDDNKEVISSNPKTIDIGIKTFLFVGAISAFGLFLNRRNKYRK
ncbi:MAG: immunoglobulin-like domain-containing protein [Paraclostridium bifermentans]